MLPLSPPIEPMLALLQETIPSGAGWIYEPKWDGFRAIVFRDGDRVVLSSRKGQPLQRYFPEVVDEAKRVLPARCVVDGEIIIAGPRGLDFEALQLRLHPAESRIRKLAKETPARFVAFDLLAVGDEVLLELPFVERRRRLLEILRPDDDVFPTPETLDRKQAARWFTRFEGAGLDGVIARRAELPYRPGERVMVKVKHERTSDCVVGGYREGKNGGVGSLLLGLYDEHGVLQHVGSTSTFKPKERRELLERLEPLRGGESFGEGRTPGEPSRWSTGKDMTWVPVEPTLVCEVRYDYLQGARFRHGTTFLRWRPDRDPRSCTFEQLAPPKPFKLEEVIALSRKGVH
ncbi:MAG: ATP-dependent DNA ligase [Myxococcaceae bacterium]